MVDCGFPVKHRVRVVAEGAWLTVSVDGGPGQSWQALAECGDLLFFAWGGLTVTVDRVQRG
ncbi:hypothetical protein CLV68_5425 [Actinokineospora cianjurensis]|uniref:Uncharacterized protein n=2 Tax=Actinokineospora cianjurensis TaxID=585224 RepID=A0A421AYU2_9PSEU|nr:hypothetical protein CLV68_5425 [Actinokineospora cianjurensis]